MKKHIVDERTGISYTLQGDYYTVQRVGGKPKAYGNSVCPAVKLRLNYPKKTKGFSFRTDGDKETTLKAASAFPYSVAPKNIMFPMIAYIVGSVLNTFMVMDRDNSALIYSSL